MRTLIDIATELGPIGVERAVNEADKRDLIDPETLRLALDGYAGEPGVAALRSLLDKRTFRLSDSDLEILFRPIANAARLPPPLTKQIVNGFEVDFFFPDLGLVVETDGLRYHRTPVDPGARRPPGPRPRPRRHDARSASPTTRSSTKPPESTPSSHAASRRCFAERIRELTTLEVGQLSLDAISSGE